MADKFQAFQLHGDLYFGVCHIPLHKLVPSNAFKLFSNNCKTTHTCFQSTSRDSKSVIRKCWWQSLSTKPKREKRREKNEKKQEEKKRREEEERKEGRRKEFCKQPNCKQRLYWLNAITRDLYSQHLHKHFYRKDKVIKYNFLWKCEGAKAFKTLLKVLEASHNFKI